ncbi:MAG: hypothetical protein ACREBR_04395 [bacterium]
MDYGHNIVNSNVCTSSTNSNSFITIKYAIKRCRECKHAHSQTEGAGCYDVIGDSVAFVICQCKEHVPQDNLEYLEYLLKKKEPL